MSKREAALLQRELVALVERLSAVQVQNRLMACTDRDLALSLLGLDAESAERVLRHVARAKADRVRDEMRMDRSRHVESRYTVMALRTIMASLQADRVVPGQRSYLRPRRPTEQ